MNVCHARSHLSVIESMDVSQLPIIWSNITVYPHLLSNSDSVCLAVLAGFFFLAAGFICLAKLDQNTFYHFLPNCPGLICMLVWFNIGRWWQGWVGSGSDWLWCQFFNVPKRNHPWQKKVTSNQWHWYISFVRFENEAVEISDFSLSLDQHVLWARLILSQDWNCIQVVWSLRTE